MYSSAQGSKVIQNYPRTVQKSGSGAEFRSLPPALKLVTKVPGSKNKASNACGIYPSCFTCTVVRPERSQKGGKKLIKLGGSSLKAKEEFIT